MKNSVDLKRCLIAYNAITSKGELKAGKYHYQGLQAWAEFDGYHCFLAYGDVVVTLMFHGKYDVQFADKDSLKRFDKKLYELTAK